MAGASESTRGIRTLPDEATGLTGAEVAWVSANALLGTPVENETPSGAINDVNTSFTLANTAVAGSVKLYEGNRRLIPTVDFSVSGATITMTYAPPTGSSLLADYRK